MYTRPEFAYGHVITNGQALVELIEELTEAFDRLKAEYDDLRADFVAISDQLEVTERERDRFESECGELRVQRDDLEYELSELRADYDAVRAELARMKEGRS